MPNGRGYMPGDDPASMTWYQIARVLAAARVEALEERPTGCAILNSAIRRFADVLDAKEHHIGDDYTRAAFEQAAGYDGERTGTTG
jgi:hypothetical protein